MLHHVTHVCMYLKIFGSKTLRTHNQPEVILVTYGDCWEIDRLVIVDLNVDGHWIGPEVHDTLD